MHGKKTRHPVIAPIAGLLIFRPHPTKFVNVRVAAVRQIPSCRLRNIAGYVTETKGGRWRAAARQRYLSFPEWPHQRITFLPQNMTLPRKYDLFDILDAIFYITETGCQWSMLPNDYPSWRAVCHHFRSWSDRGVSDAILKAPVMGRRAGKGETPEPEVAVIDSRSVRSGLPHSFRERDRRQQTHQGNKGFPIAPRSPEVCPNLEYGPDNPAMHAPLPG